MAITITGNPQPFTPGYNSVKYLLRSTNVNQNNFRFVTEVYAAGTTVTPLFVKKSAPRPGDNAGEVELSRDLQPYLTGDLPFTNTSNSGTGTPLGASASYKKIDIRFGEEYTTTWNFTGGFGITGASVSTFYQAPGTTAHTFAPSSPIIITLGATSGPLPSSFEGVVSVATTPSVYSITINKYFGPTGGSAVFGSIVKSNSRTQYLGLTSVSGITVFNGALELDEMIGYSGNSYSIGATTSKFLTSMPRSATSGLPYVNHRTSQDMWLNFAVRGFATTLRSIWVSDLGDSCYVAWGSGINQMVDQVKCGLNQIPSGATISGTLPIVKDNTSWVDFYIGSATNTQYTERVRMYIDRRCKMESYEILFMDKFGSFNSFNFPLVASVTGKIEKETYNKNLPVHYTGNTITYKSQDHTLSTWNSMVEKEITLNTNWMSWDESVYFEELLTSPYTYIKMSDNNYYNCIVTDTTNSTQAQSSKKLIRKTVTVKISPNDPINI